MTIKPPYLVPSMTEIDGVRGTNGLKVVSTFSGCGGACLGFEMAGYEIVYANEFVEAARETYAANHPNVHLDGRDIRTVKPEEILEITGLRKGELDVFEGSPPCASFSMAGARDKAWGKVKSYSDTKQRSDDLFFEFSRLLRGLQPKVFVAENVAGLVRGRARGYFKEILTELRSAGYVVSARVLDASWLGVPQARQRLVFVGVRRDLAATYGVEPIFPLPLAYQYSLTDAISLGGEVLTNDPETGHKISLEGHAVGREWDKTPIGGSSDKYFQLVRPALNKPIGTITATGGQIGAASVAHPTQKRKFTLAEVRRLSSFPDDFVLTGTFQQRYERIGRSVPPFLYFAVAKTLRDELFEVLNG